jgi:hypothetical protein
MDRLPDPSLTTGAVGFLGCPAQQAMSPPCSTCSWPGDALKKIFIAESDQRFTRCLTVSSLFIVQLFCLTAAWHPRVAVQAPAPLMRGASAPLHAPVLPNAMDLVASVAAAASAAGTLPVLAADMYVTSTAPVSSSMESTAAAPASSQVSPR